MRTIARSHGFVVAASLFVAACGSDSGHTQGANTADGGIESGAGGSSSTGGSTGSGGASSSTGGKNAGAAGSKDDLDGGAAGSPASDGGSADAGDGGVDPLKRLGANVGLPSAPTDSSGKALPKGYHPLKKPYAPIDARKEIYFAGPTFGGQREGLLDDGFTNSDNPKGTYGELLNPADPSWYQDTYRCAIPADVDGDGIQEIVAVYLDASQKLYAKVIHGPKDGKLATEDLPFVLATGVKTPTIYRDWFSHSVTAANVDDDPAEELVVGVNDLVVYDDPAHKFAPLLTKTIGADYISVAVGDFDAAPVDPRDEFAVAYSVPSGVGHYAIYDGLKQVVDAPMTPTVNDGRQNPLSFSRAMVATGNFDGDPGDELAFMGDVGSGFQLILMDDANASYRWFSSFMDDLPYDNSNLLAVDIDGDSIKELVAQHWIYDKLENVPPSSSTAKVTNIYLNDGTVPRTDINLSTTQIRAGNVSPTGDDNTRPTGEEIVAMDQGGARLVVGGYGPSGQFGWTSLGHIDTYDLGDTFAVANVDHDSEIVQFTGQHELLYSDPKIVVAMSAPPFYAGTNQENNSSTSFGKGTTEEANTTNTVGYSVGFSFGYEHEDPLGIASASFKVSVKQSFDSVASTSSTISQVITYTTGPEDSVVFSVTPFDVYYYKVVSAVDPMQVGNTMTVNVPRKPQTLLASSAYYDRYVGPDAKSAPLFSHTVGDPHSYPDVAKRDELCNGNCFESSTAIAVPQGTGSATIEISKANGKGTGASYDFSVDVESEVGVGGVTFGTSAGFHYGYSVETTTEDSNVFDGQIGALQDLTADKIYDTGLFVYREAPPGGGGDVLAVDYWVE